MKEATLKDLTSPTEAYSCNMCVVDPVEDNPQVTCMTTKDWQQTQLADHHPVSGDCEDVGWDLGPMPIQADQLTQALAAPLGMQPSQAEAGHPVQKNSAKRVQEALFQLVLSATHRKTTVM